MIEVNTDQMASFWEKVETSITEMKNSVVERLCYVGELAVKTARENGNYQDWTGNLRSSIGYVVIMDVAVVQQGGQQAVTGTEGTGEQGVEESNALLDKLKREFDKGAVLIVCAGMNYAYYVENVYHKDVLASAKLTAERMVAKLLKQ